MRGHRSLVTFAVAALVGGSMLGAVGGRPAAAAATYNLTDLGLVAPGAMNNHGDVVGKVDTATGSDAFLWTATSGLTIIPKPSGSPDEITEATAINDAGQVVVNAWWPWLTMAPSAYVWTAAGGFTPLGDITPNGNVAYGTGINNSGAVVGWSEALIYDDIYSSHPFEWTAAGGMVDLGTLVGPSGRDAGATAINDAGQVVGYSRMSLDSYDAHGFVREPDGTMTDLGTLGGTTAMPHAIGATGVVVGESTDADGQTWAFSWDAAHGMTNLGQQLSPSWGSVAYGVNAAGQIVGNYTDASGRAAGFMFDSASTDLTQLADFGGGWSGARAINARGDIAGSAATADYWTHGALWTAVVTTPPIPPNASVGDATTIEGNAATTVNVPVTLSWLSADPVTVGYTTVDSTAKSPGDYLAATGTVTIPAHATTATIPVTITGDGITEKTEKFIVKLTSVSGGGTASDATATVNILDDDAPISMSVQDAYVAEGNSGTTAMPFVVSLSRPVPTGQTVTVTAATGGGNATSGVDYTPVSTLLTFAAGDQQQTVNVDVIGDTTVEKSEKLLLKLTHAIGATASDANATGTIANDDTPPTPTVIPAVSVGDASTMEGTSGTPTSVTVPLSLSWSSDVPVTVQYTTADVSAHATADYTAVSGTVTFAPDETSKSITLAVAADDIAENAEKFSVKLSAPVGATLADPTASVNILDDDAPLSVGVADSWAAEGNSGTSPMTFTIGLSRPVPAGQSVTMNVATANVTAKAPLDFTALTTSVTFAVGEQTKTVAVDVIGDTTVEPNERFSVKLSAVVGAVVADSAATGVIVNDDPTIG